MRLVRGRGWLVACGLVLVLVWPMRSDAGTPPDLAALCARAKAAYVFVAGGSGVVIRPDGLMLTNAHVIGNQQQFDVRLGDGRHYRARVLGRDKVGDLAALKLEPKAGEQLPFLELGDSESLRIGDTALAVGNPFGLGMVDQSPTFTLGVISALHYLHGNYTECLVTDAEVNPGNSGGPLLNRSGQVVGINGQISTRWGLRSNTGLGYAISARQIRLWLPRLEAAQGGEVQHGRLSGLAFAGGAGGLPASLTVKDVADNSPAAAAGFRPGDTIVRLDGQRVANAARLASLIGIYPADHEVTFEVRRGDKDVSLKVKLPALRRSQLGISLAAPTEQDAHVKVSGVAKDSAAEKGGVKVGDEILEVGGAELKLPVLVQHKLLEAWLKNGVSAGDIVQLKVRRTNEKKEPSEMTLRIVPQ